MEKVFKKITDGVRRVLRSPVLLLGSMALFALIKVLKAPPRD